jgi:hypothetical protein
MLFLALAPDAGWSHAVVTATSLATHPIEAGHVTEVILKFNSGIEVALSRIFLVSAGDNYRPLDITAGGKRGQLIVKVPALEPGPYALKFRILAADGHVTEDVIRFNVK